LQIVPYLEQSAAWPQSGRHILARYDETSIWVYQAYRPTIARFAVEQQRFGGELTAFVAEQRVHLPNSLGALFVPAERVYSPL
jgi:hypothetical protein